MENPPLYFNWCCIMYYMITIVAQQYSENGMHNHALHLPCELKSSYPISSHMSIPMEMKYNLTKDKGV